MRFKVKLSYQHAVKKQAQDEPKPLFYNAYRSISLTITSKNRGRKNERELIIHAVKRCSRNKTQLRFIRIIRVLHFTFGHRKAESKSEGFLLIKRHNNF